MKIEFNKNNIGLSQLDLFIAIISSTLSNKVELNPNYKFIDNQLPPENHFQYSISHKIQIKEEIITIIEKLVYIERGSASSESILQFIVKIGFFKYTLINDLCNYKLLIESIKGDDVVECDVLNELQIVLKRRHDNYLINFWIEKFPATFSDIFKFKQKEADQLFYFLNESFNQILLNISFLSYYPISIYKRKNISENSHTIYVYEEHSIEFKLFSFNYNEDAYKGSYIEANFNVNPFSFSLLFFHDQQNIGFVNSARLIIKQEGEAFYKKGNHFAQLKDDLQKSF